MAKDTFSFPGKIKRPVLTKTVIRNSLWISCVIIALYLGFNFFTFIILDYQLEAGLDKQIDHEIEHFMHAFYFEGDSLVIHNPAEFGESDLVTVTDNPFFLQIYSAAGKIYVQSQNLKNYISIPLEFPAAIAENTVVKDLKVKGETLRTGYHRIMNRQGGFAGYIQLSTPKSRASEISTNIILFNLVTFPLTLIIIIIVSVLIARKNLKPVNQIIDLAKKISANNLRERLDFKADAHDEIGRLRDTLNDLFDRLESQIRQISQFTDNASHHLMSPLTILNTEVEYLLEKSKNADDCESIKVLQQQTERMIHIVKTLLILANDCKECADSRSVFDLAALIEQEVKSIFANENITFSLCDDILIRGNKDYFCLVLQNLISNAIKYSPPHSEVLFEARIENSAIKIAVKDHGDGIKPDEREMIFERFYRGSEAQNKGITGYGLGLSLVNSIVRSMGGTVEMRENVPKGSVFTVSLPKLQIE